MASCSVEILVNQNPSPLPSVDSKVLGSLLDILDTKCIDHGKLADSSSPSISAAPASKKRKATTSIESPSIKRVMSPKRVCFSPTSNYRVVAEHCNSNDYRMSSGILDEEAEQRTALVLDLDPDMPEDFEVDVDGADAEDDESLDNFAGTDDSVEDSDSEENSEPASSKTQIGSARRAGEQEATASSRDEKGPHDEKDEAKDTVEEALPFEDKLIPTKEEDGPAAATIAAQVLLSQVQKEFHRLPYSVYLQAAILQLVEKGHMSRAEVNSFKVTDKSTVSDA
jgi:hypothetical protein